MMFGKGVVEIMNRSLFYPARLAHNPPCTSTVTALRLPRVFELEFQRVGGGGRLR